MVDLPEAERPVNQSVRPVCLRRELRSARLREGCQVMLLLYVLLFNLQGGKVLGVSVSYVALVTAAMVGRPQV